MVVYFYRVCCFHYIIMELAPASYIGLLIETRQGTSKIIHFSNAEKPVALIAIGNIESKFKVLFSHRKILMKYWLSFENWEKIKK